MKKFLQKSCQWLAAFAAMFVASTSAMADDVTTTFNCQTSTVATTFTSVDGQVTLTQIEECSWTDYTFGGKGDCMMVNGIFTFAAPTGKYIKNITMSHEGYSYNWYEYSYNCYDGGEFEYSAPEFTWNGQKESVTINGKGVWYNGITSISVTYGDKEEVPTFELGTITPAQGNFAGDLSKITIAAPAGKTFQKRGGNHYLMVNGNKVNYPAGEISTDGTTMTFSTEIYKGSEGEYTIVIPEEFVKTTDGAINVETTLNYTLTYPFFTVNTWSSVTPSQDETVKSLPSFTVNTPGEMTFESVQSPVTLKLQGERDPDTWEYSYTDVEVTVALVEGKAVFTFPTPYTDKADLRFKVPAGVITATNEKSNEEFSASFSVDPYEYFTATSNLKAWASCEGPVTEIVLTVPEDVEVATADGDIKVDGSSWMISDTEIDNTNHTVTISLDDPIESGTHSIVIPQGYLKVSDFVVSRQIELYGVKVLGADEPFPNTETTPSTWSSVTNKSLSEAPIVITFARELASVDATKVSIQTSNWTTKTVAEFNVEMPEAITLTTDGKDLKVQFSDEFFASDYFSVNGYLYVKLAAGALTATNGSVNEENQYGIGFNYTALKSFTMSDAEWCTYSSTDCMVVPAGYTAYYVSGFEGESVVLTKIGDAGKTIYNYSGYIINGPAGKVYYETGLSWDAVSSNGNFLVANYEEPKTYYAANYENTWDVYSDCFMGACKLYQLSYDNDGENLGFYTQTGTNGASIEVPQGKAFLVVPDRYTAAGSIKRFVLEDGTVVTGLTAIEVPMEKDAIYNLQGQRVNATEKGGVYVKNGKKFIVK